MSRLFNEKSARWVIFDSNLELHIVVIYLL